MARLFKGDAYVIISGGASIDLSRVNEINGRRLAIDFDIKQDIDQSPNDGRVVVYNLSESTRSAMTEKDLFIEVFAGYEDIKLIGSGDVKNVIHSYKAPDWVTEITIGDGKKAYDAAVFAKSYIEGTDKKAIMDETLESFGLEIKDISTTVGGAILGGKSVVGKAKDVMSELSKEYEFDWSIQDNQILVTDKGKEDDLPAIVISSDTGLISTPRFTERGVDIESQLNPDIRPKRLVLVESIVKASSGIFICEEVQFIGNNYGGAFSVRISARAF